MNGFILSALCAFGYCGNWRVRWSKCNIFLIALTFLPAFLLAFVGLCSLWGHWTSNAKLYLLYRDPPLAELVLILLGLTGFWVISKAKHGAYYGPTWLVALILTVVSFGGWWWTEVLYDLYVIHSVPQLSASVPEPKGPEANGGVPSK